MVVLFLHFVGAIFWLVCLNMKVTKLNIVAVICVCVVVCWPRICNVFIFVRDTDFRVHFFSLFSLLFSALKFIHVCNTKTANNNRTDKYTRAPSKHSIVSTFLFPIFFNVCSNSLPSYISPSFSLVTV